MSLNKTMESLESTRVCTRCKGNKTITSFEVIRECYCCKGAGVFNKPDFDEIYIALQGRNGIRTTKPKDNKRAAYVWRMYRFHGGLDVRMPMTAVFDVSGDPYEKELDSLASALAKRFRGTDMVAAYRWGVALGYVTEDKIPSNLPPTAYPCGPEKD